MTNIYYSPLNSWKIIVPWCLLPSNSQNQITRNIKQANISQLLCVSTLHLVHRARSCKISSRKSEQSIATPSARLPALIPIYDRLSDMDSQRYRPEIIVIELRDPRSRVIILARSWPEDASFSSVEKKREGKKKRYIAMGRFCIRCLAVWIHC